MHAETAQHFLIFHQHDGARAFVRPQRRSGFLFAPRVRGMLQRQVDTEGRAVPGLAVDLHEPAMVIDYAVDHGEAEAGAFAPFFRGVKRFENMRLHLLADPAAGIDHADAGVALRFHPRELLAQFRAGDGGALERDRAALGHRVARVHAEIQQHLVKLAPVRFHQRQVVLQAEDEANRLRESRARACCPFRAASALRSSAANCASACRAEVRSCWTKAAPRSTASRITRIASGACSGGPCSRRMV